MTDKLPLVLVGSSSPTEGSLQLNDGDTVEVGSTRWLDWLEQNSSFRFESGFAGEHSFTARKHERESGAFWYAYRKLGKKLGNAYLGKSDRLTVERMLQVASKLSQPKVEIQQLGNGYAKEYITVPQQLGDDDDDSDPDLDDLTEPTDEETIKAQARKIQGYVTEIRLQEREIQAFKDERDQLRSQLEDMTTKVAKYEQQLRDSQPDLEAVRDRVLAGLRLGKQAPEYKLYQSGTRAVYRTPRDGLKCDRYCDVTHR